MKTGRYSLAQLLDNNEIEQIIIPELQRDYVWKKENVTQLLKSILLNFKNKTELCFEIKKGEEAIEPTIFEFLRKEYSRIVHATQIGFIYAYHDVDYAGKFFLIDGQQRITTLYLLLLALYKTTGKSEDFRHKYFYNHQLKLDYKVREVSHDFMMNFVEHELSDNNFLFEESEKYYKYIYSTDLTSKTLKQNYEQILLLMQSANELNISDLIDYVENYIEFNYFDTNLSEQGEQLYLYMNSRGETLSTQEILKTTIIKRATDKKEAGRKWEDWQNFFWKHRKWNSDDNTENANINADNGFEEFLRWATIIHLCTSNSEMPIEEKSSMIKIETEESKIYDQREKIKTYQIKNVSFNVEFLDGLFKGLYFLENKSMLESPFFRKGWLAEIRYAIDYVTICSVLLYLSKFSADATEIDVRRVGMYLKNICFSQSNSNDPARAVIRSLESINRLIENGNKDIIDVENNAKGSKRVVSTSDQRILDCYRGNNRALWEEQIWSITNNTDLANFLEGDYTILFDFSENKSDYPYLEEFAFYKILFEEKIFKCRKDKTLISDLLKIGDVSFADGWSTKLNIERWSLLKDEKSNWRKLFSDKTEILKNYLDEKEPAIIPSDWREPFIRYPEVLNYTRNNMFLRESEQRVILVQGTQSNEYNTRAIQIQLFHQKLPQSWVYKHDTCVQEFHLINENIIFDDRQSQKQLFIDIQYVVNNKVGNWYLYIGYRVDEEEMHCKDVLKKVSDSSCWELPEKENKAKLIEPFYIDNNALSIIDNVDKAYEKYCRLVENIK